MAPAERLSAYAEVHGLQQQKVRSSRFEHVLYRNSVRRNDVLNVYLEGDGVPWILRFFQMRDPTPRRSLMLELMSQDEGAALYLGRPCYHGLADSPGCERTLWTSGRYSPAVVNSMAEILREEVQREGVVEVNLFGHSGGGALALLMAAQIPEVRHVVTLAGNLDTDAWIRYHGYTPLYTSLNPARRLSLPTRVEQIHLMGGQDTNIPPQLNRGWILRQANATGRVIGSFSHNCCWTRVWPDVLRRLGGDHSVGWPGQSLARFKPQHAAGH